MGFVRFACFLLVVLPVTSLSLMKFHQEDKNGVEDSFPSLEKEFLSNNIGGRKLGVQEAKDQLASSKNLGGGSKEKIISNMDASSSNFNGEINYGKINKKIIINSRFEIRKKLGSGSALVYSNADYLTHMHHPPRHN